MLFSQLGFFLSFFSQIGSNFLFFLLFLLFSLFDNKHGILIACYDLLVDFCLLHFFSLYFLLLFFLELFHLLKQDLGLSLLLFSGFKSVNLSRLDLFDDNFLAFESFKSFLLFDFLLFLDLFESLKFHDFVFFLLLDFESLPLSFFLFQLSLSNGSGLGIGDHFVHFLYIIKLLLSDLNSSLVDLFFVF